MKRVLLIDFDTPCYASASVTQERQIEVLHKPTGLTKMFGTRTELKERLKQLDKLDKLETDYEIKDIQIPEPVANTCHVLKSLVKNYIADTNPDSVEFFISGKDNFREALELPSKYKDNRKDMLRPVNLKDVRQYAINKYKPMVCDGYEADDAIVFRGYEILNQGDMPILAVIDKDAFAYSGLYVYNPDHPDRGVKQLPDLGSLWLDDKNKVRGEGFLWYCFQHLNGDTTDNFKPTEICGVRFGEKSAYKLLKDCQTKQEALQKVVEQFKVWYPLPVTYKDWEGKEQTKNYLEIAQLYFKCCRMKVTKNDDLDFVKFCKQHGVKLYDEPETVLQS